MGATPLVSVIIPVYQAADFVESAVLSAISFPEVGEVILVEDGSTDESYAKCYELQSMHDKVFLITHQDRKNLGAAASRNLGIRKAKFPFIAFLDADDYFLSNRFQEFCRLIAEKLEFDGVYEQIQYFNGSERIYGISKPLPAKQLLNFLIRGTYGHFHTNGIIVKKDTIVNAGLFVESLDLHEDSDLWLKLAFYGSLISGRDFRPVSMVRRHAGNRIWKGTSNSSRLKQWRVTWGWARTKRIGILNKLLILRKLLKYKIGSLRE